MKTLPGMLILALLCGTSWSTEALPPPYQPMVLDKVRFQLSTRDFVTTQSGLVQVNVNATLSNTDLIKARGEIIANLVKIAPGDWHLIQFNRTQDSSGLEKLDVLAEARVVESKLADIYVNAKAISKPGMNYAIAGIEFKPTLEEVQAVKLKLREKLYLLVQAEINRLNKAYPGQAYSVHKIQFIEGDMPAAYPVAKAERSMMFAASAPSLTVSNELILSAIVKLASTRK